MRDEDNEEFVRQLSASYGQMESVLGADGYKAMVSDHIAHQIHVTARSEVLKALANGIRTVTGLAVLGAIPAIVWVWKWALNA